MIETMKVETYNFGVWVWFEYQFEINNYAFFEVKMNRKMKKKTVSGEDVNLVENYKLRLGHQFHLCVFSPYHPDE